MTTPSGGAPRIGISLGLARPAARPASTPVAAPAVVAAPVAAPAAMTAPPAVDHAAALAALAAVISRTPPPAVAATPTTTVDLTMDGFFRPDDFHAGHVKEIVVQHGTPERPTVTVRFDGANFSIHSPTGSGIRFDVTRGLATLPNLTAYTRPRDGDAIIISIPGQAEKLRWVWKTPAVMPAEAAPTPAPADPVTAPATDAPLTANQVHDALTPQQGGAVNSDTVLSPADICFRVETLRTISKGADAAMVANGNQGSIEGLSGVGHTRKGKGDAVNRTGIGYAVVRADNAKVAPTEVCIAAEGTDAEASGIVIEEILAALTASDPSDPKGTAIQRVAYLVEEGIKAAHARIRALAPNADDTPQGTTVQVSITNEETVVNLWVGDTVGFAIPAATGFGGLYHPAHSLSRVPFTKPHVLQADGTAIEGDIANETVWLRAAGAGAKPLLLGRGDYVPASHTLTENVALDKGGWHGMATSTLVGKGLGLGEVRNAILGATADGVHEAALRIREKWGTAVDSGKPLQIRGSRMSSSQAHKLLPLRTITDGSTAFWLNRVPLPRQRDAERKAAIAILRRLRKLKPQEFAVTDTQLQQIELNRLLGAAEIAKAGRYTENPEVILRVLGIPAVTTTT